LVLVELAALLELAVSVLDQTDRMVLMAVTRRLVL
jgi:hypothetical protein